jgi:hypothetical protein
MSFSLYLQYHIYFKNIGVKTIVEISNIILFALQKAKLVLDNVCFGNFLIVPT